MDSRACPLWLIRQRCAFIGIQLVGIVSGLPVVRPESDEDLGSGDQPWDLFDSILFLSETRFLLHVVVSSELVAIRWKPSAEPDTGSSRVS